MQKVVMSASKVAFHCLTRSREVNGLLACLLKGTYNQTMDAKGRMTFPTKLRELIGERFIVTKGIDGCLFVYSLEDFEKRAEKIRSLPMAKARALQRSFMAWACEVEPDKQGRILVPQSLREVAGLEKEIVVAEYLTDVRYGIKSAGTISTAALMITSLWKLWRGLIFNGI